MCACMHLCVCVRTCVCQLTSMCLVLSTKQFVTTNNVNYQSPLPTDLLLTSNSRMDTGNGLIQTITWTLDVCVSSLVCTADGQAPSWAGELHHRRLHV